MLANKTERTPADPTRVNTNEQWEVEFWCTKFRVTPDVLRASGVEAGPRTEDVARQLRKAGHRLPERRCNRSVPQHP